MLCFKVMLQVDIDRSEIKEGVPEERRILNKVEDSRSYLTDHAVQALLPALPLRQGRQVWPPSRRTWSETPAWFRTKLFVASDASIALSFSDVSDAHQFFTSPLRSSNNLDYRANPPHGRNTDIGCR